jgi:hypothetical protein
MTVGKPTVAGGSWKPHTMHAVEEPFKAVRGKWLLAGMLIVLVAAVLWLVREVHWRFPSDHGLAAAEADAPDSTPPWACVIEAIESGDLPGTTFGWKIEIADRADFEIVTPFYRYRAAIADGRLAYWRGQGWQTADADLECDG